MPKKFTFYNEHNVPTHICYLTSEQCQAHLNNGNQCRRRSVIGVPYCWTHLQNILHLKIRPSQIQGAGLGLFAWDPKQAADAIIFRANDKIVDYYGDIVTSNDLQHWYGDHTAPYAASIVDDLEEDAACRRGIGSLINHTTNPVKINSKLWMVDGHIEIFATKNIQNRREILLNYGNQYTFNDPTHYVTRNVRHIDNDQM